MLPLYEDNHIIIVNKYPGEIVQGDKTGDKPLCEILKDYLKEKYKKPGNVFCGVVHRIDRPVGGVVVFAKTSKALSRLNDMLRKGEIHKTYWALVEGHIEKPYGVLENYMVSDGRINKSFITNSTTSGAKKAVLEYKVLASGDKYTLLEINLKTGRKHQIRLQLSNIGHPIKGDLKYGAKRSNKDGGISLLARRIEFIHPVSKMKIDVLAPPFAEMEKIYNTAQESHTNK
ncbi:MAG: RNA pseudouridine synthase [Prevotella sp.]|nr:RNA pseudouridine synthase [Bacteroides sp.]MCM1365960.1 RNA pseudouridine synthase [Prevotella sp.]MCM1436619.1 RNA pseudouridine synthase [Prevotella sp.]